MSRTLPLRPLADNPRLFIGSVPRFTDEKTLWQAFSVFGEIHDVRLQAGRAWVEFKSVSDCEFAASSGTSIRIGKDTVNYSLSKPRPLTGPAARAPRTPFPSPAPAVASRRDRSPIGDRIHRVSDVPPAPVPAAPAEMYSPERVALPPPPREPSPLRLPAAAYASNGWTTTSWTPPPPPPPPVMFIWKPPISEACAENKRVREEWAAEAAIRVERARTAQARSFPCAMWEQHPIKRRCAVTGRPILDTFRSSFGGHLVPATFEYRDGPYRVWSDEYIPRPVYPSDRTGNVMFGPPREDKTSTGRTAEQRRAWYIGAIDDLKAGRIDDVLEGAQDDEFIMDCDDDMSTPMAPVTAAALRLEKLLLNELKKMKSQ